MTYLMAVFLGFVQGVAEFLPISSSGHLSVFQNLFNLNTAEGGHMFFDVLLHLGTLVSVCVVYWSDISTMIREFFGLVREIKNPDKRIKTYKIIEVYMISFLRKLIFLQKLPICTAAFFR